MTAPSTILVDLRVTQINGDRGIPAYSQSLVLELVRGYPRHHWLLLHDPVRPLPSRAEELGRHARWLTVAELEEPGLPPIDVLFTGCFFFVPHKGRTTDALIPPVVRHQRPRRMGIVYDLIPLLFADRYLTNPATKGKYFDALEVLRGCDHLFAISRATRRDTILHAAIDPRRVHCIYGDIDHTKQALMARPAAETADLPAHFGIFGPYCIYVGGDDWRKNLNAAVESFAIFHRDHPKHQLAIVCKLSNERISDVRRAAAAVGLPGGTVICTGHVTDDALVGLVRHADMLVFPSLYEGLGLPVLESYGCGTPVVGSNTSSVAELVLPALSCDPREPASIAGAMARLSANSDLREQSLAFGRRLIADELGWARAAERVMEHVERRPKGTAGLASPSLPDAHKPLTKSHAGVAVAVVSASEGSVTSPRQTPQREAVRGPWARAAYYVASPKVRQKPPAGSGSSPHVLPVEVLPAALLRGRHDVTIFVLDGSPTDGPIIEAIFRTRRTPARRLAWLRATWIDALVQDEEQNEPLCILVDRGEIDGLVVDSQICRDRLKVALGPLAETHAIEVACLPLDALAGAVSTGPGTKAACSRGAA